MRDHARTKNAVRIWSFVAQPRIYIRQMTLPQIDILFARAMTMLCNEQLLTSACKARRRSRAKPFPCLGALHSSVILLPFIQFKEVKVMVEAGRIPSCAPNGRLVALRVHRRRISDQLFAFS